MVSDEIRINRYLKEAIHKFYEKKERDEKALSSPDIDRRFWVDLYAYMLQKLEVHLLYDERQIHRLCHELYDVFTAPRIYELFDDVRETLDTLKARGFRLALVSNFAASLKEILQEKGIASCFEAMVISTLVGCEKPNPEIFRIALRRTGLKARDVLYVGDHEVNDIWAPNQIGMDAVRIIRYDYQTGSGIRSLHELFGANLPVRRKEV